MELVIKNLPASVGDIRDMGSIPGLGRSPGGGHGNPLQYSCLENPADREAWWVAVHRVTKSWTLLKQLCTHNLDGKSVQYWLPLAGSSKTLGVLASIFLLCRKALFAPWPCPRNSSQYLPHWRLRDSYFDTLEQTQESRARPRCSFWPGQPIIF